MLRRLLPSSGLLPWSRTPASPPCMCVISWLECAQPSQLERMRNTLISIDRIVSTKACS